MQARWLFCFYGVLKNIDWQDGAFKLTKRLLIAYLIGFFAFSSVTGLFLFNPFGTKETQAAWFNDNWAYRKALTIDESKVSGSTNLADFPILVSLTSDSGLSANAQSDGDDIVFTSLNGERLDHEIESYSAGTLVAWVRIPSLSYNTNTTIYMYYGNPSVNSQQNARGVWKSSYAAVYHLGEGAVTTISDSTVNNNVASKLSTTEPAAYSSGKIGGAQDFDGADDVITKTGLIQGSTITISGWADLDAHDTQGAEFLSIGDNVTLRLDDNGVGRKTLGSYNQGGSWVDTETNIDYQGTGWHYFTYVADPGSSSQKVYVDGVQRATDSSGAAIVFTGNGSNTVIGQHGNGGTTQRFNGRIDETRVSTTSRTVDWALTEYNNQNAPSSFYSTGSEEKGTSPTLYWKFDDAQGTTAQDATATNLDGSLAGNLPINGGPVKIDDPGNAVDQDIVRTSSGVLYALVEDSPTLEIWKSSDGTSWTQQDAGTTISSKSFTQSRMAIDSTNVIHVIYVLSSTDDLTYRTFNTSTDTWGSAETIASDFTSFDVGGISIDAANKPHIFYLGITGSITPQYRNRVGGSWSSSVDIESAGGNVYGTITISDEDVPEIVYVYNPGTITVRAAVGNLNNASSFTKQSIETSANNVVQNVVDIAIDSSGNTWVAFIDENGATDYATLIKHNDGDAWGTWQSPVTNSNGASRLSLAIDGTTAYLLYLDGNNDVSYLKYTGSWTGPVVLQAGTMDLLYAKWSYLNNNQGSSQIDYLYSDGSDSNWASIGLSVATSTPDWKSEDMCISGKCLFFDGTNADTVVKADDANLDFAATDSFSVGAWIKRSGTVSANSYLIVKTDISTGGYKVYMDDSGDLCFGIDDDSTWGPDVSSCTNGVDFDDDKWHYVVGVRDVTADKTYLYIDGAERDNDTDVTTTTLANTGGFIVGVDLDGSSGKWKGYIDEVKVYRSALSATQIKANFAARSSAEGVSGVLGANTQNQSGALSSGLTGYWKIDESSGTSLTDSSGRANTGTLNGSTRISGKFGGGADFPGSAGNYIGTSIALSTFMSASEGTVSLWVRPEGAAPSVSNAYDGTPIFDAGGYAAINQGSIGGQDRLWLYNYDGNDDRIGVTYTANEWVHITWVHSGGTLYAYKNGALVGTTSSGNTSSLASSVLIATGYSGLYFDGKMDEIRVYNRGLSGAEVAQLYNWAPGPVSYWPLDEKSGTRYDVGSLGNNLTDNNTVTAGNGRLGNGGLFTRANNEYLSIADGSQSGLDFGYGMTISAWVKLSALPPTNEWSEIVSKYAFTAGNYRSYNLTVTNAGGVINFQAEVSNDGLDTGKQTITGSTVPVANTWYHVALTYDGTNLRLYVNGAQDATPVALTGPIFNGAAIFYIGQIDDASQSNRPWNGVIDEVKVYNYGRTQGQVVEDMNAAHPAPGSPVGSAVAYWKFDEGYSTTAFDSNTSTAGAEDLTLSTATSSWSTAGKFGKAFSGGAARWLSRTDDNDLDLQTTTSGTDSAASTTFSFWIKTATGTNPSAREYIVQKAASGATNGGYSIYSTTDSSGKICFGIDDDNSGNPNSEDSVCNDTDVYDQNWHHIAAVKTNLSRLDLYVDGIAAGTPDTSISSASNSLNNTSTFFIADRDGADNGDEFNGSTDEFKIFSSALTSDQVRLDMNRGQAEQIGSLSSSQSLPNSADAEYCIPGDTSTCTAPVGRWDFEEGSGSSAQDNSGNGNTGTNSNTTYVVGKVGKGQSFTSGSTSKVTTSISTHPTTFTIEAWVYSTSNSGIDTVISKDTSGASKDGFFMREDSANFDCGVMTAAADTFANSPSRPSNVLNTWVHWTCTYDGTTLRQYKNGVLISTGTGSMDTSTGTFTIGSGYSGASESFDGNIDNVRYFNYTRSAAQIAWDYNQGKPVGYWKMDECQGATINDSSGNSNTGTLTLGAGTYTTPGTCSVSSASSAWYNGVSGKTNYSLAFDGTDDYVDAGSGSSLAVTDFTLSSWMNFSSVTPSTDDPTIMNRGFSSGNNENFYWYLDPNGSNCSSASCFTYGFRDTGGTVRDHTYNFTPTLGTWYQFAIVFSDTLNTIKVYQNGVEVDSEAETNTPQTSNSGGTQKLMIGMDRTNCGSACAMAGKLDDVKVYNYPLTAIQVKTLYNDGAIRFGPTSGAP